MLEEIATFGPREFDFGAIDRETVQVWNLGWRSAQPLEQAKFFLLADLRKSKYAS
jgi:hypothetical protein